VTPKFFKGQTALRGRHHGHVSITGKLFHSICFFWQRPGSESESERVMHRATASEIIFSRFASSEKFHLLK